MTTPSKHNNTKQYNTIQHNTTQFSLRHILTIPIGGMLHKTLPVIHCCVKLQFLSLIWPSRETQGFSNIPIVRGSAVFMKSNIFTRIFSPIPEINTFKYHVFCTDGKISVRINLPLFSTVVPSIICMFMSCRPFVVIPTLTGLVGVEVTSVPWLGQLTDGV